MTAYLPSQFIFKAFDNLGNPLAGGQLFTYQSGTSIPLATYTDNTGTVSAANPIILDAYGQATIWLSANSYRFNLLDANSVQMPDYPIDGVTAVSSSGGGSSSGNTIITSQTITATAGQTVFNLASSYLQGLNLLSVYQNGSRLILGLDYVETSTTSVTLLLGVSLGDNLTFVIVSNLNTIIVSAINVSYTPSGTGAVSTTVAAKLQQSVSVLDFGADPTGSADSTIALQAAITGATGKCLYIPSGTYKISSALTVPSNIKIKGDGNGTIINQVSNNFSAFAATGGTRVVVRDLVCTFPSTGGASSASWPAGVSLQSCNNCTVENVEVNYAPWSGILLMNTNYSTVRNCRINSLNQNASNGEDDLHDIGIYQNSSNNLITGNFCNGGIITGNTTMRTHGVFLQAPSPGPYYPTGNVISNNQIGAHSAYGIVAYRGGLTNNYNSKTQITGNTVTGITGTALSGGSGTGIYIQGMGGTIVSGNHVENCNISTTNFGTLAISHITVTNVGADTVTGATASFATNQMTVTAVAGVYTTTTLPVGTVVTAQGVPTGTVVSSQVGSTNVYNLSTTPGTIASAAVQLAGTPAGTAYPVIIKDNIVNAPQGYGIQAATNNVPVILSGNTVTLTGTAGTSGCSVKITNSTGAKFINNVVSHANPNFNAVSLVASGLCLDGLDVSGNDIYAAPGANGISQDFTSSGVYSNVRVNNNKVWGCTTAVGCQGMSFQSTNGLLVTNNNVESVMVALQISNCPNTRMSNNRITSTRGTYGILFIGSNLNSVCDGSNVLTGIVENDNGNGMILEQYAASIPTGTAIRNVGDRYWSTTPTSTTTPGWVVTTGGGNGTYVLTAMPVL